MVSNIVKIELLRSIAFYFFALIGMVLYRKRKEHAILSKTPLSVTTPQPPQKLYRNLKIIIIVVLVYIFYLYMSVSAEYNLIQIFIWLAVFIFLVLLFGNMFLKGIPKGLNHPFLRALAFFFVIHIFIFMRDLAFGCYSIRPRFIVLGAALIMYVVLSKLIGWVTKLFKTESIKA